jgi:PKD repeat protein
VRKIRFSIQLGAFVLFSLMSVAAGTKFQATTTLSAETGNNTSAASTFTSQTNGNVGATNISKVPTRTLLYANSTTRIFSHFMPWFGFANHMSVGYASDDSLQVQKQVADMVSRGLDGTAIDWYGRGQSNSHYLAYDQTAQFVMQQAELQTAFSFVIAYDAGALKSCAATLGCDVTQAAIDDLNYANVTYENSPAYLHVGTQPVVFFFGDEAYNIDWARVRSGVAGNPLFVFRNSGAFTHAQSGGGYSWLAPTTATPTDPMALLYLDYFYRTALTFTGSFSMGSAYKGFNDSLAAWGTNRLVNQQCGQTWLQSMAEAGKYYSGANQLPFLQVVTWNDYEEGTEIETGIDNCVTVSASVTGTVASWSITGQANTVDHYSVYISQDGQNLMWLADAASAGSMDLAPFGFNAGNYLVFVKATGKPSLTNKMSAAVQVTIPNKPPVAVLNVTPLSGPAPLNVTASTVGSTDVDGNIAGTTINFGDGSAIVSAVSASHNYATAGTFTVTATVTDNLGATANQTAIVTVKSVNKPPVAVLAVTPSTGYAPVTVSASTAGSTDPDGAVASSVINWGDGTPSSSSGPSASHAYSAAGTYTITATVTDNLGATASTTATITVQAPQVLISSPVSSALSTTQTVQTLNSPIHVVASGFSGFTVTAMQIYLDGTLVYTISSAAIDTSVAASPGAHNFVVKGWDSSGRNFSSAFSVMVNAPPVAALSLTATSVLAGGSITASAAGSTDSDGRFLAGKINFGDGTVISGFSATHQYTLAGTYTITATVTDNAGASSSKNQTITVKPRFVTITSPIASRISSSSVLVAGTAFSGYPVTATQIYVDGSLKYQTNTASISRTLAIGVGTHSITVQGWDSSGATFKTSVTLTRN